VDTKTFLENFGVIADAPNGIAQLRSVILELASTRRLVDFHSRTFETVSIDDLCDYVQRGKSPQYADEGQVKVVSQKCVKWSGFDPGPSRYISNNSISTYKDERFLRDGDLLWNSTGTGTLGRTVIFKNQFDDARYVADSHVTVLRTTEAEPRFLQIWSASPTIQELVLGSATGTTNQQELNLASVKALTIDLPDRDIQKEIVAKVDELMALCDELEAVKAKQEALRSAARDSAIDAISTATTPDELSIAWSRISNNWETFANSKQGVKVLRQLVLDLAVRGLLDTGVKSDGDASGFIREFGNAGVREVKGPPHAIPDNWRWAFFGDVSKNRDSQRIPLSKSDRELRQGPYDYYGASGVIDSIDDYIFDETLMLIGEDGANLINRSTPIAFLARGKYWVNNHAHVIGSIDESALSYLALAINAIDLKPYVTGTAQPKLNQAKLNSIPLPIPPLAEQERIVSKVDQFMKFCDELEDNLELRVQIESAFAHASSQLQAV
jgi:type I restriction enzyme S subunit